MDRSILYIYNGPGVVEESFSHTHRALQNSLGNIFYIKPLSTQELIEGSWRHNAKLIAMPGGRDLPYVKYLAGKGNQQIKDFVACGGVYLGICAGSYYGSSYVEFDKGGPLEVVGDRELSFFEGKAIGPYLAPFDYHSNAGVRAAAISTPYSEILHLYFNGGAYFENAALYSNVAVLANYDTTPEKQAAIIEITYGKGKALLSGVHFEYDPNFLSNQDPYIQKELPQLLASNTKRLAFTDALLQRIASV